MSNKSTDKIDKKKNLIIYLAYIFSFLSEV